MKKTILFALVTLGAVALFACQETKRTDEAANLYAQHCASCHSADLSGGTGGSLLDDEWAHGGSDEQIARVIREGAVDQGMPAWSGVLDDKQIRSMVIYIREQRAQTADSVNLDRFKNDAGPYDAAGHQYVLEQLGETEGVPWALAFLPDGSLLVTQRDGILWRFENGERTRISGIPEVWASGQGGVLDVQVHPDYSENGWVYLSFSENIGAGKEDKPAGMTTVVRGKIEQDRWTDQQTIFRADPSLRVATAYHFGSRFVLFDGYLYFGIGDRGRQDQAQDLSRANGKIFRFFEDGSVPPDNPFLDTDDALPGIWSYGHRNPQGLTLDTTTGLIWESEHGPRGGDELNLIEKGKNYGWPVIPYGMNYDGTPMTSETQRDGMEQPVHYWVPSIATSGIEFYQGDAFAKWRGRLLVTGMASNELRLLTIEGRKVTKDEIVLKGKGRVRDVAVGPDGNIYLLLGSGSSGNGRLVRMAPSE